MIELAMTKLNRDEYGSPRCYLSLDSWGRRWSFTYGTMQIFTSFTPEAAVAGAAVYGAVPDPEIFWDARRDMWNDLAGVAA